MCTNRHIHTHTHIHIHEYTHIPIFRRGCFCASGLEPQRSAGVCAASMLRASMSASLPYTMPSGMLRGAHSHRCSMVWSRRGYLDVELNRHKLGNAGQPAVVPSEDEIVAMRQAALVPLIVAVIRHGETSPSRCNSFANSAPHLLCRTLPKPTCRTRYYRHRSGVLVATAPTRLAPCRCTAVGPLHVHTSDAQHSVASAPLIPAVGPCRGRLSA